MCLIVFDWQAEHHLYLSANRDEFYQRDAAPLAQWQDHPNIYAGRDLTQQGTWLGINHQQRFAALTNVRVLDVGPSNPPTRGNIIPSFLQHGGAVIDWGHAILRQADRYAPFNLIFGDVQQLYSLTNYPTPQLTSLHSGLFVLSNAQLNSPWPKARLAKQQMQAWIQSHQDMSTLSQLLSSRVQAHDRDLPNTGVGQVWERLLSAQFIISPSYGTRCSTGLKILPKQTIIQERSWDTSGKQTHERTLTLPLDVF